MLSKFSVKKPLTVIMALIMVIILGYVSFTNTTTDLLPNMDLPYVAIITTYGGAGPEKVEKTLTKPLEQKLATLNGVENMTSISASNYSVVIVEFSEKTNLDSAIIEMSSSASQITNSLGASVGTPIYMKINPDLLPVVIASIDFKDLDRKEVSDRVEKDILPALERVDGVASVNATGLLENTMKITIDDEKIDKLNEKIIKAVDEKLLEAENKLDEAQEKIDDGKAKLEAAKKEQNDKLAAASVAIQSGMTQLLIGKNTVDTTVSLLDTVDGYIKEIDDALIKAEESSANIKDIRPQLKMLIMSIRSELRAAKGSIDDTISSLDKDSDSYKTTYDLLTKISGKLSRRISRCDDALESLNKAKTVKEAVRSVRVSVSEIKNQCRSLKKTMSETSDRLQEQYDILSEQQKTLESGKMTYSQEITLAQVELNNAQSELSEGRKEFEKAKESAYEKAGLDGAITLNTVSQLISAENFSMPVGNLKEDNVTYAVKVGDLFGAGEELENWELFNISVGDIGVITLKDIATIEYLDNSEDMYAKVNGNDGLLVTIDKQSTYSTTDVAHNVQKAIKKLEKENDGLSITALSDQGEYIDLVIASVLKALISGGALAILILLVFLRDFKPTLIIAISIPASLLFAIVLMYFTGVSLNIISLAGLALGVGMLVDNSIVVVENIYRLKALGMPIKEAAVDGAKQVGGAIIASTLTTVSVFLPIVFTTGITKQIFSDMGLTIAYSLAASLIVALTLVPALSSLILKKKKDKKSIVLDKLINGYAVLLERALKRKALVIILVIFMLGLSIFGVTQMGTEFIPQSDSKQVSVSVEVPKGTSVEEAREMSEQVIGILEEIDDIETIAAMQGGSGMMSMMSAGGDGNNISMYLVLKDNRKHTSQEVGEKIEKLTQDLDCTVKASSANMNMSMLTGEGVEIAIKGTDLDDLQKAAYDVGEMLKDIEGTTDITTGLEEVSQEIRIIVDKNKAMAKGYTVAQIYMKVAEAIQTENTATTLETADNEFSVIVAAGESSILSVDELRELEFDVVDMGSMDDMDTTALGDDTKNSDDSETSDGVDEDKVKLCDIADISFADAPNSITHNNQIRTMSVKASVDADHNVGKISNQLESKLKEYDFPGDCYYETDGENEAVMSALRDLVYMALIAIAFIYMIMVAQFQSLKSPFIVMFTIPLAFTGGFLLLWILQFNISVVAMLGLLVLSGVVVNNGIVFVDYANQLMDEGMALNTALIETGKARIRPIIMTATTTILGLMSIALGIGDGTDMIQPMGIVVVGGLLYATLLTLFVIPVLYAIFNKKKGQS